jgi:hypothetical protein
MEIEQKTDKTCAKCRGDGIGSSANRKFIV